LPPSNDRPQLGTPTGSPDEVASEPSELTAPPPFLQPAGIQRLLNSSVAGAPAQLRGPWIVTGPLACGEQSATYRAICPGLRTSLLIKLPHGGGASASSQYEALRTAGQRLHGQDQLRVPNAYPYLLDEGFLITDWVDGPTVRQFLRSPERRLHAALWALGLAGKWLRAFHGDRGISLAYLDTDQLILRTSLALTQVGECRAPPRRFESDFVLLQRVQPLLAKIPVKSSLLHGDFKPANVIINKDNAVGVDISGAFEGPVVEDLAHFLLHLNLALFEPIGLRWLPWRPALEAAFLRGYDPDGSAIPPITLAWARLQRVLRHYCDRTALRGNWIRAGVVKLSYTQSARHVATELRRLLAQAEGQHWE
jgi:hypothetical protein